MAARKAAPSPRVAAAPLKAHHYVRTYVRYDLKRELQDAYVSTTMRMYVSTFVRRTYLRAHARTYT